MEGLLILVCGFRDFSPSASVLLVRGQLRQSVMAVIIWQELLTCDRQEVQRSRKGLGQASSQMASSQYLLSQARSHLLLGPSNPLTLRLDIAIYKYVGSYSWYLGINRAQGSHVDHACFPETPN